MSHIRFGKEKVERKEHRQRHEKDPLIGRTGVLKPHLIGNHYIYMPNIWCVWVNARHVHALSFCEFIHAVIMLI